MQDAINPIYSNNKTNIVALPDYIIPMLLSKELDLDTIVANVNSLDGVLKVCSNKISNYDIKDIVSANIILYKDILGYTSNDSYLLYINNIAKELNHTPNDLINVVNAYRDTSNSFSNFNIKEELKVSNLPSNVELPFSIKYTDKLIFLILHAGFTEIIIKNNYNSKMLYIKVILQSLFNMYGEDALVTSSVFSAYLRNRYLCYKDKLQ